MANPRGEADAWHTPCALSADMDPSAGVDRSESVAAPVPGGVGEVTAPLVPGDSVRWGPIVAGLLVAISTFLLLSLLAVVFGAQSVATEGVDAGTAGQASAWVTAVLALLAFLFGGFVAGRTSAVAVAGGAAGLLNGFLVWALGIVLIAALTALGLGQLFGAVGDLFGRFQALGVQVPAGEAVDRQQLAANIRNSALIAFLSMALPAIASAAGGWLGARRRREAPPY